MGPTYAFEGPLTNVFDPFIVADLTPEGRENANTKAKEYLGILTEATLVMEEKRALEELAKSDSPFRLEFPDINNPKMRYTMKPSEYLVLVENALQALN